MANIIDGKGLIEILEAFSLHTQDVNAAFLLISKSAYLRIKDNTVWVKSWPAGYSNARVVAVGSEEGGVKKWTYRVKTEADKNEKFERCNNFEAQFAWYLGKCIYEHIGPGMDLKPNLDPIKTRIRILLEKYGWDSHEAESFIKIHINPDIQIAKRNIIEELTRSQFSPDEIRRIEQSTNLYEIAKYQLRNLATALVYMAKNTIEIYDVSQDLDHEMYRFAANGSESLFDIDLVEMVATMSQYGFSGREGRQALFRLAEKGNQLAAFEIGELYFYGYITGNQLPDFEKAYTYYYKAKDYPPALWRIGYCIVKNYYPPVPKDKIDYKKALEYFEKAIDDQSPYGIFARALTSIGMLWLEGKYPARDFKEKREFEPKDIDKAFGYFVDAGGRGDYDAWNKVGHLADALEEHEKAVKAYENSIELVPNSEAYTCIGSYYENYTEDIDKACKYYLKAVNDVLEGDVYPLAMFNAGRVYTNRVQGQPLNYYDINKGFELFYGALTTKKAETGFKLTGKIVNEMLSIMKSRPAFPKIEDYNHWAKLTITWVDMYNKATDVDTEETNGDLQARLDKLQI